MDNITGQPSGIKITAHVVGWMVFFIAPVILSPGRDMEVYFSEPGIFSSLVLRNLLLMLLFYVNMFYFTPRLFTSGKHTAFFFTIGFFIVVAGTANYIIHEALNGTGPFDNNMHGPPHGPPPDFPPPGDHGARRPPRRLMLASPYFTSLLIATLVAAASTLLVLWDTWIRSKANEQERHLQKVAAELSVLKLQISPHFLFNTLNNIRWLVRSGSAHAEPAIVKLSQLLRYILYQASQEKVSLQKEVDHLQDYVALQKMRLPEGLALDLSVKGDLNGWKIVPLLLIPLVENFFKHGDFTTPSKSRLELTITGDKLTFQTINKILRPHEKEPGESGIGIGNVRKRLALHYPSLHELTCHEAGDEYYVKLNIILSN